MSHEYSMRIEVIGADSSLDDQILDEVCPKWWNGADYGRKGDALVIQGFDRLCGGDGPMEFQENLEAQLQGMFGPHILVRVSGEDREGVDYGERFTYGPP